MSAAPNEHPPPSPEAGNERAVKHGAYSPKLVRKDASALEQRIWEAAPHLSDRDELAVKRYAAAEAIVSRLTSYVATNGAFDSHGRVRPALEHLRKWLERADKSSARLGLDPVSRAALHNDVAHTATALADLARKDLQEGRRLREAAERRLELPVISAVDLIAPQPAREEDA